ncbi:DarT ssDNA thymidine ADP-ribosyltransferase family protein [Rhodoplanes serenus]|uniref:DarT ssDNA thymidine ADP-ribosyltransferase family protein n=1 Tax=Rhodoplanes serenus TaxID=200615 RepID=UPI000DAB6008|nr:DarT ssDNA thymidine ADP-ribosyltransferase family protein [Rhodoplanes serenus]RAI37115.1 hypothetical protein CH340_01000 [Rhodoplanes serenus]
MTPKELDAFVDRVKKSRWGGFFHFTDRKNIPLIKQHGLLSMKELNKRSIVVPAPGGNEISRIADVGCGMDKYVHLTFKPGHPMEKSAVEDKRITDLVHLKINPELILQSGVLITNDVANKNGVRVGSPTDMLDHIDLDVIYDWMDWKDKAVLARLKTAEKCEVIIPTCIPIEYVLNHG